MSGKLQSESNYGVNVRCQLICNVNGSNKAKQRSHNRDAPVLTGDGNKW